MNDLPYSCQDYAEMDSVDAVYALKSVIETPADHLIQLKYDGIWALVVIEKRKITICSKTGQIKHCWTDPGMLFEGGRTVLIGEYMFGSQWSQHASRKGAIYVFDCLEADGAKLDHLPYKDRVRKATSVVADLGEPFRLLACYSLDKLGPLWLKLEKENTHEGVVIRKWSQPWQATLLKLKLTVEDDYVVMGFNDGEGKYEGTLGSLKLGQWDGKDLVWVMDASGGLSDNDRANIWENQKFCVGKVVLVSGKARFTSGALRHPTIVRFRDDKTMEQCILKRTTSGLVNE